MVQNRHSELLLAALATIGEGVSVFDADLTLVAANEHYVELLALPPELVRPGTDLREILAFQARRGDFGTGEAASIDYRIRAYWLAGDIDLERNFHGDRIMRVRRRRLPDGGIVTTYADVTAARRAEAALRRSESRFRDFAEAASDWLWEWDADRRFTWLSERIAGVLGRPQSAFIGKRREEIGRIDVDEPGWRDHLQDIAARRPFHGFRYRSVYPERVRWFEQSGKPIFAPDGQFIGYRGTGREITALVEAEAQARLSHERLAGAIAALPHAVGQFDRDGRMVAFNDAYKRMHAGLDHIFKVGLTWPELLRAALANGSPALPADEHAAYIARRMAYHRNPEGSFERPLANGEWQEIIETTLPDGGFLVIIHDITARKRAEAEANRAQVQLAAAIDGMPLVIGVFDAQDRLVTWNRAYAELMARSGLPLEIGKTFEELVRYSAASGKVGVPEAEREAYIAARIAFHANPVGSFERQFGDNTWQELHEYRLPDGGLMLVMSDISERKRTEAALGRSEQRLALHLEQTPLGAVEWGPDGRVVAWNQAAERIFGYRREEVVGRSSAELLIPEHIRPQVEGTLRSVWRGEGGRRSTNENLTKDGRVIICDWYNTPLIGSDGRVMGVASLVQDITQRIAAEAELREAKEAAEASDRTKSEFLANISHELRTPLNAIIGFSEVISEAMMGPVGTPRYIEYARDIRSSGVHLLAIINDLLDISKIEAGRFELHEDEASPAELLDASMRLVLERAEKGGVHCDLTISSELPLLIVDPRAMKQILLNLLSNAVKFTPPGGNVHATAHVDTSGGIVFTVSDTGIGIKPEDIPRALAPFTQIDSQFNRRHEGTGLGLPLAKKLVELHGGSLDLASTPGQGTAVTVCLPARRLIAQRKVANKQ